MVGRSLRHSVAKSRLRLARPRLAWLAALLLGWCCLASTETPAQPPLKTADIVRVTAERMHRLSIVDVELCSFHLQKSAIGQIAFNEDASTAVLTPFSGRVTRLIAKIGDEVKRGDPLFEIDSPEVVQAQTDLIAAVQALEKSRSQLALARNVADRQAGLYAAKATSQRELEQARADQAAAETDVRTAEGVLTAARHRLRMLGRSEAEVARVEREHTIDPLITVNAPIAGTVIARKVGPGQYVRSDAGDQLYAISDLTTMWVKASVPESDIRLVHVGQEIEVSVGAVPGRVFKARVIAIGAAIGPGDAARARALGDPQPGRRTESGDVRHLQDRHRRRRAGARRRHRGRDPRRGRGHRLGGTRADAVRAPQGVLGIGTGRPGAGARGVEAGRARRWARRRLFGKLAELIARSAEIRTRRASCFRLAVSAQRIRDPESSACTSTAPVRAASATDGLATALVLYSSGFRSPSIVGSSSDTVGWMCTARCITV